MPRRTKALGVWLDGQRIATLEQRRWPAIRCRYEEAALKSWPLNSPVISCSLPLSERPQDALPFCKGLLPEGQALQTLAAQAGLAVNDTFELLARYGRDVAGALVLSEHAPEPGAFGVEAYTRDALAAAIDDLDDHPLGSHDDSELSLAGLQDKLLLVDLGDGHWGRPLHGRPSTHILKVDDPRHPGLVVAESQCLALAREAGVTTIDQRLERFGDAPALIVSRFDRRPVDGELRRVHQEDLCQATGIDPDGDRGRAKYERAGGPKLAQAAQLLEFYAPDPARELDRLVAAITFTVLIGNADAHGKNLAFVHPTPQTVELAPLYDTVPTVLWPKLRTEAAMSIGGRRELSDVTADDIVREAASWPHGANPTRAVISTTAETVLAAIEHETIPRESAVAKYVVARATRLLATNPPS